MIRSPHREVALVGLTPRGLARLLAYARQGVRTLGLDLDATLVNQIKNGTHPLTTFPFEEFKGFLDSQTIRVTSHPQELSACHQLIILGDTLLTAHLEPDLSPLEKTLELIGPFVSRDTLVVLEAPLYPGATESKLKPLLERLTGLTAGADFYLATAWGDAGLDPITARPRQGANWIVGGLSPRSTTLATALYQKLFKQILPVSDLKTAEMIPVAHHLRQMTLAALAEELSRFCAALNIQASAVEEALLALCPNYAAFARADVEASLAPGLISWQCKALPVSFPNHVMEGVAAHLAQRPQQLVHLVIEALNSRQKSLRGSHILLIGLTTNPETGEDQHSLAYPVMRLLEQYGAEISFYDPALATIPAVASRGFPAHWARKRSIEWSEESLACFDAVVNLTCYPAQSAIEVDPKGFSKARKTSGSRTGE